MTRLNTPTIPMLIGGAAAIALLSGGAVWLATRQPALPPAAVEARSGEDAGHADEDGGPAEEEGVIELTGAQVQAAGIVLSPVTPGGGGETRLSGRVEPMVDARAAVAAAVAGRVERVLVAPGQAVRAGQPIAIVVSGDAASLRAEVDAAQAAYVAAEQAHSRDEELADLGVVARREAEVSHAEAVSAQATARAARARAAASGAPDASGRLSVTSPISGVVTSVQVGPGGFVAAGGVVADVVNPARVELVFNAPPQLAATVRPGATMRVTSPAGEFSAVVTGVAADAGADDSGATVIRARPQGGRLPPAGSPVTGAIVTGEQSDVLTVPSEAVQSVENRSVVFVRTANGFRATPVLTGREAAGRIEILRGLTGSEQVAGANAFLLKAELAKGDTEHGH